MKFLYDHFEKLCWTGSLAELEECIKYIDVSNTHFDYDFINIASTRHDVKFLELFIKHGFDIHYDNDNLLGVAIERNDHKLRDYLIEVQKFDIEKLKGTNAYSKYQNDVEKYEVFANDLVFDAPLEELIKYVKENHIDVNQNNADSVRTFMGRDDVKANYKLFIQLYTNLDVRINKSILSYASECGYIEIVKYLVEVKGYNPEMLKGCSSYSNHKHIHDYFKSRLLQLP